MPGDVHLVRVAAEARGIAVNPGNPPADLLGHRRQVAFRFEDVVEVERDEVDAGIDEHLRLVSLSSGIARAPRPAVDVDVDRRTRFPGREEVEFLRFRGTVPDDGAAARASDGGLALLRVARGQVCLVG